LEKLISNLFKREAVSQTSESYLSNKRKQPKIRLLQKYLHYQI